MKFGWSWLLVVLLAAPMIGCGPKENAPQGDPIAKDGDDHADHGHAEDLPGAVKELTGYRDAISDGFKENDSEKAHGPLHEVAHVLEGMLDHMDHMTEGLSAEDKASVEASTKKLFDLFMEVDAKMHGQEGVDYADVSDEVDAEVAKLNAIVEGGSQPTEPAKEPAAEPAKEPAAEPAKEPATDK